VLTPPTNQVCSVASGSGTIAAANISNVAVTCVSTFTIGGTVSGLTGAGLVLQNGAGNTLSITGIAPFTFAARVNGGSIYNVTVQTQPNGQTCSIANGSGTASANVTNIAVTCAGPFTIGGTVTGLTGAGLVLQNNGGNNLTVVSAGAFTFSTGIAPGAAYAVSVLTQPPGQTCTVISGNGTASAPVTIITVNCVASTTGSYTVNGSISGLTSSGLVLQLNGAGNMTVASGANSFSFPSALVTGTTYAVTVLTQPPAPKQTCVVANGSGTIGNANVADVAITCTTDTFTIGGTVTGLTGTGMLLQLNTANDLAVSTAAFTFTNAPQASNSVYSVTIKTQPSGQTCTMDRGLGFLTPAANINNVAVNCIANTTSPLSGTYSVIAGGVPQRAFLTLFADGTYIFGTHSADPACPPNNGNGVEYGVYRWSSTNNAFAFVNAVVDTNGACGIANGTSLTTGTVTRNATSGVLTADLLDINAPGAHIAATLTPVPSTTGSIIGSWGTNIGFQVFLGNNTTFFAIVEGLQNLAPTVLTPGIEDGCYALTGGTTASGSFTYDFNPNTCIVDSLFAVDTNGTSGQSGTGPNGPSATNFTVTGDSLQTQTGTAAPTVRPRLVTN
jgi:hypothetical protein